MNRVPPKIPEPPPGKWKPRQPSRIYDYNYKVGQSYYTPQTKYIGSKPLERTEQYKPPEAQTYAERFASAPIYGRAHGLPYDEKQSVYRQPSPVLKSGTSRARSVSRDSDTSGYLASLGPKDKFNIQDRRSFRRQSLCEDSTDSNKFPTRDTSRTRSSALDELRKVKENLEKDLKKFPSLPPTVPRRDEKKVVFKQETGPRGSTIIKREETVTSSPRISRRFSTTQRDTDGGKPPVSLRVRKTSYNEPETFETPSYFRSRRASFGQSEGIQIPGSKFENFVKYSSQTNAGSAAGDETPRFRSAAHFREARKVIDSEEIADKIKKTFENQKSRYLEDATADITSMTRSLRGSRLDPFEDDGPRGRARQRARLNHFSYGV